MVHDFKRFPELTNNQMQVYYFESPHKQITEDFTAKVVKVHDGDTITVQWEERDFNFPIRFIDTAAPELNEPGGKRSQKWLESRLLKEDVDVIINTNNRVGKWGRILGTIMFQGLNINQESINLGFAIPFSQRKEGRLPDFDKELTFDFPNF